MAPDRVTVNTGSTSTFKGDNERGHDGPWTTIFDGVPTESARPTIKT